MKKVIAFLLMLSILVASFTGMVWAEEPEKVNAAGFYTIGSETGVAITPQTSEGAVITATSADVNSDEKYEKFYPDSEKLKVEVSGAVSGKQYLVILTTGTTLPDSSSKICYINQVEATGTTVDFTVYPMVPTETTQMALFVTSNDTYFTTKTVTLNYAIEGEYNKAPYTLGDINDDGEYTAGDALCALEMVVGKGSWTDIQRLAADVDGNQDITANDALWILEAAVGKRSF